MNNYPIGDFLIRIKNAYLAGKKELVCPHSKSIASIGKILVDEGYLKKIKEGDNQGRKTITVELLYKGRRAALTDIKIISKPSVHEYFDIKKLKKGGRKFGMSIISTNKGIMTGKNAQKENVGGEVICKVF